MKRLARIPCAIFLGCALVAPVAASAQAANVELLGVRIGDRCVQGNDLGYDRMVLDVRGRVKDVATVLAEGVLTVSSNIPVSDNDFADVNTVLSGNPEWVFSGVRAVAGQPATFALSLTDNVSTEDPVFTVSVLKGAYPEGSSNQSRLVIDVNEDTPDSCP